jgi:hypothetical protein
MADTRSPLTQKNHANLRLAPGYAHTRGLQIVPISAAEASLAAREFLIVFPEKSPVPAVLLGIKRNAYVKADGAWAADYVPAALRHGPFSIARARSKPEEAPRSIVMVDTASAALGTQGTPVFGADGRAAPDVMARAQLQAAHQRAMRATARLVKALDDKGLLATRNWLVRLDDGSTARVTGMRFVDARKLRALGAADLEALSRGGALALAHTHICSEANLAVGLLARNFPALRGAAQADTRTKTATKPAPAQSAAGVAKKRSAR